MLTEALLGAVSQAVVERVANVAELEERLRHWLGRDPAQLAFKKAFTRAYTAFARQYPELTASFFDEHFLTQHATPELAKLLSRTQHPDPAALAALWTQQLRIQPPNITPAISDFLGWLKGELQAEEVFRPVFDSRALETLPTLEAKLETLVQLLQQQARQAQQMANRYAVQTEGGAAIMGAVHTGGGDFIGRDQNIYNTYFQGDFATLDDYYVRPDAVFQRVKLEQFVGRAWLDMKVDEFLHNPKRKSGVLIVEGEAGVGKTSFLAHLVQARRYLHLFAEQLPGEANVGRAIQSLAAQLVARYRIEPYARRDAIPQNPSMFPDFLDRLLRLAVQGLTAGEQIVIVGDALDEAGSVAGGNVFGLPKVLPDGVYLILSQRPVQVPLSFTYAPNRLQLKAGSPENIADVQSYLTTVARRPAIAQQLQAHHYSEAEFVRTLAAKSAGVWMYLLYVIDEIEQGERAPLNLAQLPASLAGYYAQYWRRWRYQANQFDIQPKWDSLYAPLLGALAAIQEPATLPRLIAWAGVPATPPEVKRLLTEQWRAFISQQQPGATDETRYRLYHLSLRDFITGHVSGELPLGEGSLVEELRTQVTAAHHRIVAQYRAQCNGQWENLVPVDDYAQSYLATHLKEVEPQTLFDLVARTDIWAKARDAHEGSYAGYLVDLALAWQWRDNDERNVGGQIRCALIKSSIHALASKIPPNLLVLAVKTNLWNVARALAHVSQISNESRRVEALSGLVPHLPAELMSEALALARSITEESSRVWALRSLAPHLPAELMSEALALARSIIDESRRVEALSDLAPHLPAEEQQSVIQEALALARSITDESSCIGALSGLAPHLPAEEQQPVVQEALALARSITDLSRRVWTLRSLVAHLPAEEQKPVIQETLALARSITDQSNRVQALSGLAPHLPAEQQSVIQEALALAYSITEESRRLEALRSLVPHLPAKEQQPVIQEALALAYSITEESRRVEALSGLAPHLPTELMSEALALARSITEDSKRIWALRSLASHLPAEEQQPVVQEALALARSITEESRRVWALRSLVAHLPAEEQQPVIQEVLALAHSITDQFSRAQIMSDLAPHLPAELMSEALALARSITDLSRRAQALSDLAPHLPAEEQQPVAQEALALARSITDESSRVQVLGSLAPHLPAELMSEALALARSITDLSKRVQALRSLVPYLPAKEQQPVIQEALALARSITEESNRVWALRSLASHLPAEEQQSIIQEALALTRSITEESRRVWALRSLVAHLPAEEQQSVIQEALALTRSITEESNRAQALSGLAPHLPVELMSEALALARSITDLSSRIWVLSGLAPHLPVELMSEALALARSITDLSSRAQLLSDLAPHLPTELMSEALALARSITEESSRVWALRSLAPHLPAEEQQSVIQEALALARSITDLSRRVWVLSGLAPHLPAELMSEALALTRSITDLSSRAQLLSDLAPYLPAEEQPPVVQEALALARSITDLSSRAQVLGSLTLYQMKQAQGQSALYNFLDVAAISDESKRSAALSELVQLWQAFGCGGLDLDNWPQLLRLLATRPRDDLLRDLTVLLPVIHHLGGDEAMSEMLHAIRDISAWWP